MSKFILWILALAGLIVIALLVAPAFIPASVYEDQIELRASEALGREVTIEGAPSVTFLPAQITVQGLKVANAEGFDAPHLVAVDEADIGIKLLPLLSRQVEITRFHLKNPDIRLETNGETSNWTLGPTADPSAEPTGTEDNESSQELPDIRLGDVRLNGGQVSYQGPDGKIWEATDADLVLTLDSLDEPLGLSGEMIVQGEPSTVEAAFTTPRSYAENGSAELDLDMTVGTNRAELNMTFTNELSFNGDLDINFPALRSLFALAGVDLGTDNGFRSVRLKGPVKGNTQNVAFGQGTEIAFDNMTGNGAVTIDVSRTRPKISGNLSLGTLNLVPYLPPEPAEFAAVKSEQRESFPEWSNDRMDFSALAAVDADLDIQTENIILPSLDIGASLLSLDANAGDVLVNVSRTSLYGGMGSGTLRANASRTPDITVDFILKGVDAGLLAREVAGISRMRGKGDIIFDKVTLRGNTQAEMIRSLDGQIRLDLANGAFEGVNLGKIGRAALETYDTLTGENGGLNAANLQTITSNIITQAQGPREETDFSDLTLGLMAQNGTVNAPTFRLEGPYYQITGGGEVNLPSQTMQIRLTPSVALEGSDIRRKLPIPIQISGSFNSPNVGLDYQPVLQSLVKDRVGDVLRDQGVDLSDGETIEDALRNTVQDELFRRLSGDSDNDTSVDEAPVSDNQESESEEESLEEALIREGLGALFGGQDEDEEGGN